MKPQPTTKEALLLLGNKESLPLILEQFLTRSNTGYQDLKRAVIALSTYMGIRVGMGAISLKNHKPNNCEYLKTQKEIGGEPMPRLLQGKP